MLYPIVLHAGRCRTSRTFISPLEEKMSSLDKPASAADIPVTEGSNYPEPFASLMRKRKKAKLGDAFGLTRYGVNRTTLAPGGISALFHTHTVQEEFVYVLEGRVTLKLGESSYVLGPGDCMGFVPGKGIGHHLVNESDAPAVFLEVGDRAVGDEGAYPNDDLAATMTPEGKWAFVHKDGTPY